MILIGKKRELAANKISDLITTSVQTRMKAPLPIGEPVNHPEASMHPFDHVVRANATPTLGREFVQQMDGISTPLSSQSATSLCFNPIPEVIA